MFDAYIIITCRFDVIEYKYTRKLDCCKIIRQEKILRKEKLTVEGIL